MKIESTLMPTTPPVAAIARRRSSVRLRWWWRSANADECDAITGRVASSIRWSVHVAPRCDTSSMIPSALADRNRLDAGLGEPAAGSILGGSVGEHGAAEMRERGDTDSEPVQRREEGDVGSDRLAPLERQNQCDHAVGERGVDVRTGQADAHRVRVLRCDTPPGLQHPQCLAQRSLGTEVVVDEDREHLDVDAARAQPGQPDISEVLALLGRLAGAHRA